MTRSITTPETYETYMGSFELLAQQALDMASYERTTDVILDLVKRYTNYIIPGQKHGSMPDFILKSKRGDIEIGTLLLDEKIIKVGEIPEKDLDNYESFMLVNAMLVFNYIKLKTVKIIKS